MSVKTGALMIGNLKLPQFLVVHFTTAKLHPRAHPAVHRRAQVVSRTATSKAARRWRYIRPPCTLAPNPAYIHSDDIINIKRSLDAEDYFAVAIGAFGRFLSELDSELASMQKEGGGGVNESSVHTEL